MDSSGVHKRVSLSLSLGLGLTLAVEASVVVAVDGGKSGGKSGVDSRVDSGGGNTVDSRGGNVVDSRVDSRGGNVVDGRSGSVDSTVADGAKTRDNAVAVVDSGDDSTVGQTVGNLPNGVGIRLSLSPGGGNKKYKSEGPHDWRRLVLRAFAFVLLVAT